MHAAVIEGDVERLELLLERGANPNEVHHVYVGTGVHSRRIVQSFTPLFRISSDVPIETNIEIIDALLEAGADPYEKVGPFSLTPCDYWAELYDSASKDREAARPVIITLLERGIDPLEFAGSGSHFLLHIALSRDIDLLNMALTADYSNATIRRVEQQIHRRVDSGEVGLDSDLENVLVILNGQTT